MQNLTHLILPDLRQMLPEMDSDAVVEAFEDFHPADVADILENVDDAMAVKVFETLPIAVSVKAFEHMEEPEQARLLERLGRPTMIKLIERMSSDDRVDLLQTLPERTVESILPLLAQAERNDIKNLLSHEEGTAGAVMTTEYASVPGDMTVRDALAQLRKVAPERETIYEIFVIDAERHLQGRLGLRRLVLARPDEVVADIMTPPPASCHVGDDQEDVARIIEKYDVLALPVLDAEERLVGIVTQDDVIDVIEEEATEDAHLMGGVNPLDVPYFQESFFDLAKKRVVWLSMLFIGGMLTTTAIRHYDVVLSSMTILMAFLPLIISSGGNSGSQSATLITRGLAVGDVQLSDWRRIVKRELLMGVCLGFLLAPLGVLRASMMGSPGWFQVAVGITLVAVVTAGSIVGACLPLVSKRLGFDPAVSSTPFVSSIVDVVGIVIYINIARFLWSA